MLKTEKSFGRELRASNISSGVSSSSFLRTRIFFVGRCWRATEFSMRYRIFILLDFLFSCCVLIFLAPLRWDLRSAPSSCMSFGAISPDTTQYVIQSQHAPKSKEFSLTWLYERTLPWASLTKLPLFSSLKLCAWTVGHI